MAPNLKGGAVEGKNCNGSNPVAPLPTFPQTKKSKRESCGGNGRRNESKVVEVERGESTTAQRNLSYISHWDIIVVGLRNKKPIRAAASIYI
jgi:hypothetical protein